MNGWRFALAAVCLAAALGCRRDAAVAPVANVQEVTVTKVSMSESNSVGKVVRSEEEWRRLLSPEQFRVLRQAGTERAFGAAYDEFKKQGGGTYVCAGCGAELFSSNEKFDSHCGWPSFYDPANAKNVKTRTDTSHGMVRTEVLCAVCDGHLGHLFKGEGFKTPKDQRFCINAVSLKFIPATNDVSNPAK